MRDIEMTGEGTMSLTLTAESAIIDGARSYAEHSGMTLEAFVLAYLESVAKREQNRRKQEAHEMFDYLMAQKGSLVDSYTFNREDANARR
jgi:hypothetical protein